MAKVVLSAAAQLDVIDAVDWYELQAPGLGGRLIAEIGAAIARVGSNPRQYPLVHRTLRRVLVRRFPYALFYRSSGDAVEVIACLHTSRDSRQWRARA